MRARDALAPQPPPPPPAGVSAPSLDRTHSSATGIPAAGAPCRPDLACALHGYSGGLLIVLRPMTRITRIEAQVCLSRAVYRYSLDCCTGTHFVPVHLDGCTYTDVVFCQPEARVCAFGGVVPVHFFRVPVHFFVYRYTLPDCKLAAFEGCICYCCFSIHTPRPLESFLSWENREDKTPYMCRHMAGLGMLPGGPPPVPEHDRLIWVVLVCFGKAKDVKITKSALKTSPRGQIVQNLHWSKTALGTGPWQGGTVPLADRCGILEATDPWQGGTGPRTRTQRKGPKFG
uniref:Uncharacterized protein n=1 Tax=Ananas comosus var. bracteatus TaxID=296719 RepID=A0A6V7PHC1_ANACO|nr:unnamed protein product [Ananas comosus var. bracteatus]